MRSVDLDNPFYLYIEDETGLNALGADEPDMQINLDGSLTPISAESWDDADAGALAGPARGGPGLRRDRDARRDK